MQNKYDDLKIFEKHVDEYRKERKALIKQRD